MDEPVKVKYIPVEAVKEYIKRYTWLTANFDEIVEKYGIDVVRYKNVVNITEREMRAVEYSTDWNNIFEYVKEAVASNLVDEAINKHAKYIGKNYYPERNSTEYRYDIMIGEIPKRQQKGEEE